MPLELNRYPGQKVRVTLAGGVLASYLTLEIQHLVEYEETKGAGGEVLLRYTLHEDAKIMLKAESDSVQNSATIEANTPVESFEYESVETGNPNMLPDSFWTKFPIDKWKIGPVTINQDDKAQQWDAELTPNHIDIPAEVTP